MTEPATPSSSGAQAALAGALGFGVVSTVVFATVAFAEVWMYQHLSIFGAYLVWTVLFIALGGWVLHRLLARDGLLPKFYLIFCLAFLAYAVGWTGIYFVVRGPAGEWIASLLGSVLMAVVFAFAFRVPGLAWRLSAVLFVANSTGYFIGSVLHSSIGGRAGMMLWGVAYGLFLGSGLGLSLHQVQTHRKSGYK